VCEQCGSFFFRKTKRLKKFCKKECGWDFNNQRRVESGEQAEYMRRKRADGKYI